MPLDPVYQAFCTRKLPFSPAPPDLYREVLVYAEGVESGKRLLSCLKGYLHPVESDQLITHLQTTALGDFIQTDDHKILAIQPDLKAERGYLLAVSNSARYSMPTFT